MYYVHQSLQSQVVTNPLVFLLSTMRDWLDHLTFFRGRVSVKRCRRRGEYDTWQKRTYKTLTSLEGRVPQDIVALAPGYELRYTDECGGASVHLGMDLDGHYYFYGQKFTSELQVVMSWLGDAPYYCHRSQERLGDTRPVKSLEGYCREVIDAWAVDGRPLHVSQSSLEDPVYTVSHDFGQSITNSEELTKHIRQLPSGRRLICRIYNGSVWTKLIISHTLDGHYFATYQSARNLFSEILVTTPHTNNCDAIVSQG